MSPIRSLTRRLVSAAFTLLLLSPHTTAQVVFSESFESPVVSGFDDNTVPSGGNWIGANKGFGSTNRGLYHETVAWPATPPFTTPFGDQSYYLNYTNSGLTTAQGVTGQTLTAGVTYTVTFHTAVTDGTTSAGYDVELVAFEASDDNTARGDMSGDGVGTILASLSGTTTTTDMSDFHQLVLTADASNPHLGKELGIRIDKASGSMLYDNIRLVVGHDLNPSPADGEDLDAGGDVTLSWTNHPPNAPATETRVDVWFGSTSGALVQVVDGQLVSSTVVNAPTAGTWYWRIDSYPDGDPNGTPVTGDVFLFTIADTDGDGFPDDYEIIHSGTNTGLNPGDDLENAGAGDGLTNLEEYQYGTDPNDPDSDDDNLEDGPEINGTAGLRPATNPLLADTDDDGLDDDVESNTGTWVSTADTGTNPIDPDWDKDGLIDGAETNDDNWVDRHVTGSDPFDTDSDDDGAGDWYEVVATFTDPNSDAETSPIPYPLPDPDGSTGDAAKPVKVYIMGGQSNTVGIGYIDDPDPGSLASITRKENKFPNLIDATSDWTKRNDVIYRGVVTANTKNGPLTAYQGADGSRVGPELGFGHVMGWFHDEDVLIIKGSQGNRSLGWDFLPPDSPQFVIGSTTYAGYGDSPASWETGTTPVPVNWYAGKQYDECFRDESLWGATGFDPITNAADILNFTTGQLQNLPTAGNDLNGRSYEIAGFVWWQGHKDHTDGVYAPRYEENLVNLIHKVRADFNALAAPFVVATIGFGGGDIATKPALYQAVYNAQKNIADHPDFAGSGTVKSVDTLPYWRELSESPGGQDFHYNNNAETYTLVGDAMGRAMISLQNDVSPPTPVTFEIAPTAVDPTTVGMIANTATDPSGPVEYFFENTTNASNSGWITPTRWDDTGLAPGSYDYRFKTRDAEGNESDWSPTVSAAPGTDNTQPSPDPMSFAAPPTAQGENGVTMTATAASDINDVEYEFVNTAGGGNSSGWQDSTTYTDTGLNPGTGYTYQVRARDKSSAQNTTGFSSTASATTDAPDTTAPNPNPMTFDVPPTATGETTITMTADTASDPSGVEYRFNNVTLTTDSGWQDSTTYEATGLTPDTEYTFTVQARDKSPAQTATAPSGPASATTDAPDTTAPEMSLLSPANGSGNIAVSSDLVVTFNEDIMIGTGDLTLTNITDSTQVVIAVTDASQVSAADAVLTIAPSSPLEAGKDYAVQIAGTAIDDLAGNRFLGIADNSTWTFSTLAPPSGGTLVDEDFEDFDNTGAGWDLTTGSSDASVLNDASKATGGDYSLRIQTGSPYQVAVTPSFNLTAATEVTIAFDYKDDDGGSTRFLEVEFWNGSSWQLVKKISQTSSYPDGRYSYTITSGFAADNKFRFEGKNGGGGGTRGAYIDNLLITAVLPGGGQVDKFAISSIASPQTVGTPITGITITAQDAADATATDFTGTVTFGGTGGFSGTSASFVDGVLSGVSVTPTVAGSDLTFTVDDGSGHTGSTTIALIDPVETAYETWSGGLDFETDTNGDGIANGLAFALGAPNLQADALALLPSAAAEPGFLTLQFQRAGDLGEAQLYVEHGNDLGGWNQLLIPAASTTDPHLAGGVQVVVAPGSPNDTVTVKIPDSLESVSGTLFGRLRVTEN